NEYPLVNQARIGFGLTPKPRSHPASNVNWCGASSFWLKFHIGPKTRSTPTRKCTSAPYQPDVSKSERNKPAASTMNGNRHGGVIPVGGAGGWAEGGTGG